MEFLKDIWEFFVKKSHELRSHAKTHEEEKEDDEINIAFQSIMRIMSHIIAVSLIYLIFIDTSN